MYYISPFRSLGIADFDVLDKSALNLAKKKLLAEIELSPTNTIIREGKELSKDTILKTFDNLSQIGNWEAHRAIAKNPTLLAFLENQTFSKSTLFLKENLYQNNDFIEFVSPYFSRSYKKILLNCLQKNDFALLIKLVNHTPKIMTRADIYDTDSVLESWVLSKIQEIDDRSHDIENGVRFKEKEIEALYDLDWIKCLGELPAEFIDLKNNYARSLYNLASDVWNAFFHKRAKKIIKNARWLQCSAYERGLIDEYYQFFEDSDSYSSTMIYWRMYHMTIFNKPEGITLTISWLLKIIATPYYLTMSIWEKFSEWVKQFAVGEFFILVGNFIMSFFSVFYNVGLLFLFLNAFVWTYDLFTGGNKEKTYAEKPILNDLDNWIYYYRDEMNGMRYETAEEGQQLRLKYDTLVNRRNLYTKAFKRFYAIEDSFRTYNDLTVQERKSYGGAWLQDSVTLYRSNLTPIVRINNFLMLFPRGADVRTKKGVLDTVATNELNKKIMEARDSLRFYDAQLKKMGEFK